MTIKTIPFLLTVSIFVLSSLNSFAGTVDRAAVQRALLEKALDSSKPASERCEAINSLAEAADPGALKVTAELLKDPSVESCALRTIGLQRNGFAAEALIGNVEKYLNSTASKGPYENNLKARLSAINSIWSLGEIGDPKLMSKLSEFYNSADDVIKMNLIVSMGKLKNNSKSAPYLYAIASDPRETEVVRAIAFEVIEKKLGLPATTINLSPSSKTGIEKGDLIYTGGIVGTVSGWFSPDLPIGHAGIFAGAETKDGKISVVIADCVPNNFKPGGVRNIYSFYDFTHHYMYPYYGNRTARTKPTAAQRDRIVSLALDLGKKGLKYSNTHFSQKGPEEFDCVGYTEYVYEQAGVNPTDDSYESGTGWPLTPYEQFEATQPNVAPASPIIIPGPITVIPYAPSYKTINSMVQPFAGAVEEPEINLETTPQAEN